MKKICALLIAVCALTSCSVHSAYTIAINQSAHPIAINYIDISDSLLRTAMVFPGQLASLPPNRKLENLTLLEISTGKSGLAWHNFRADGPKIACSGNCRIVWTKKQQIKLGPTA